MGTHLRIIPALAMIGALTLGGTSAARAQDTSAVRSDTSAYRGYGGDSMGTDTARAAQPAGQADTTGFKYTGPTTDTALKAKPGVQTGPAPSDTGKAGGMSRAASDTVVCKDGSTSPRTGEVCLNHGGIDWVATEAALKARGEPTTLPAGGADTGGAAAPTDTSSGR